MQYFLLNGFGKQKLFSAECESLKIYQLKILKNEENCKFCRILLCDIFDGLKLLYLRGVGFLFNPCVLNSFHKYIRTVAFYAWKLMV